MPSGAKKRKAAKKKLQKAYNGAHSQANEVSLGEENAAEIDDGQLKKEEESTNDMSVESEEHKSSSSNGSSSSSSSSSSDNEEIAVEKEKSIVLVSRETEYEDESLNPESVQIVPEDKNENISSVITNSVDEKCNTKSDPVMENLVDEKQVLVCNVPVPVRRSSWLDCCGIFEAFSGGSSR